MTPLRKAARAKVLIESGSDDFDALSEELQEQVIESVKAVLMAIREPSEAMVMAGDEQPVLDGSDKRWRAMIDAAIAEE